MTVASTNGQEISHHIFGEGPPIVFVSSMTMNHFPWTIYQKDYFVNEGYKVVVFDNRDTGKSSNSVTES